MSDTPQREQSEHGSSDERAGRKPHGSKLFWRLVRGGPTPRSDLQSPSVNDRRLYDVRTFNPMSHTDAVLYLGEYHTRVRVLREWLTLNREYFEREDVSAWTASYYIPDDFEAAWHELRECDEFAHFTRRDGPATAAASQTECPYCDATPTNLPRHLRNSDCP